MLMLTLIKLSLLAIVRLALNVIVVGLGRLVKQKTCSDFLVILFLGRHQMGWHLVVVERVGIATRVLRWDLRRGQRARVPVKSGRIVGPASTWSPGHWPEFVRRWFRSLNCFQTKPLSVAGFWRLVGFQWRIIEWRGCVIRGLGLYGRRWRCRRWRCRRGRGRCLFPLLLPSGPVLVVRVVLHVFHPKPFRLLNTGSSFSWSQRLPFFTWWRKK